MKRRDSDWFGTGSAAGLIALVAVIIVWTLVFAAIIGGIVYVLERPSLAQQPTTVTPTAAISIQPTSGPPGTTVTVQGTGWAASSNVFIYLLPPGEAQITGAAAAAVTVDTQGQFAVQVGIPSTCYLLRRHLPAHLHLRRRPSHQYLRRRPSRQHLHPRHSRHLPSRRQLLGSTCMFAAARAPIIRLSEC
jgi:hypothetical protein